MISSLYASIPLLLFLSLTPLTATAAKASALAELETSRHGPRATQATSSNGIGHGHASSTEASTISAQPGRLVIFFHGVKGRGSVMDAIADSWRRTLPNTRFVAPDAPSPHRSGGYQWFVVDDQVMRPDRIEAARRAFDGLVADIVEREGFENDLENVAFVAVSQGAIMALDAVATGRWKVGALVSFAGLLPLPPTSPSSGTSILLMHGGADRTIPSAASVAASGQLKSAGYDVSLKVFPDVGHTISSDEASEAAIFLRDKYYR
ncbi:prolyl oligopeptidase family serine peptidase [Rhizobium sp. XQZ8]|uniref:alpha/beta hydrolase n=1 Tax=Rhizobium populisoli TaxID=2859785 RepID=UPI001CA51668|nr:dienelactone hydrolase family protein [Rhizobium populisoli]MBW6424834.1 prolyl oligopeptidase family serine peptidase [Rhizobium populisoli]